MTVKEILQRITMELQLRKVQLATDMVEGQISDFNHYQKIVGMAEGLMQADAIVNGIIEQIEKEDE
jgi:ribosomal protein S12 methylthiotransferase accessory factor YcaO|tara:strand:- start:2906 stop:3103 length:198 start_codon:yes stop_codon:yes gene_type:complete